MARQVAVFDLPMDVPLANNLLENPQIRVRKKTFSVNKKEGLAILVLEYEVDEAGQNPPQAIRFFTLPTEEALANAFFERTDIEVMKTHYETTLFGSVILIIEYEKLN